jgi:hypothetical protein
MGYGNCRAMENVEKRTACFPTVSHRAWKTRQKTTTPSFPQLPQPLLLYILRKKGGKSAKVRRLDQIVMDKRELGA